MTLLTVKDIATRLKVKEKTVYAWASQGRIPCVRIGNVLRFDDSEIEQWLRRCRVPMGPGGSLLLNKQVKRPFDNVNALIERAKRAVYTAAGETSIASPFRKEEQDGSR
ncbi:MAG: helix-turn-helix domain-containing protein [Nitrospira sp.]